MGYTAKVGRALQAATEPIEASEKLTFQSSWEEKRMKIIIISAERDSKNIILCIGTIINCIKHNNILYCTERLIVVDKHPRIVVVIL